MPDQPRGILAKKVYQIYKVMLDLGELSKPGFDMPIAALTRTEAGFPRLGKIRKGDEKAGNRPGKDLDYFRVVTDRPGLADKVRELYGNEPKEIKVWLPYATPEENFDPWMKEYGSAGLKRRERQSDG